MDAWGQAVFTSVSFGHWGTVLNVNAGACAVVAMPVFSFSFIRQKFCNKV